MEKPDCISHAIGIVDQPRATRSKRSDRFVCELAGVQQFRCRGARPDLSQMRLARAFGSPKRACPGWPAGARLDEGRCGLVRPAVNEILTLVARGVSER